MGYLSRSVMGYLRRRRTQAASPCTATWMSSAAICQVPIRQLWLHIRQISEAVPHVVALTPSTVELIATLGALSPPRWARPGPSPHNIGCAFVNFGDASVSPRREVLRTP